MTRNLICISTADADVLQEIVDNPSLLSSSTYRDKIAQTMNNLRMALAMEPYEETKAMDDSECYCAWDGAGSPGTLENFKSIVRAMESRLLQPTRDERKIRRLLCATYAGSLAYMDDGEAQDNREQPFIDFLRMDADTIDRLIRERNMRQFQREQNAKQERPNEGS